MALNVFGRFMPPEESFTSLFCRQAEKIVEAARELRAMVAAEHEAAVHVSAIRAIEVAADGVAKPIFVARADRQARRRHTITGAIIGVDAARRASAVRRGVARRVVVAWIVTLPAAGLIAALSYHAARRFI